MKPDLQKTFIVAEGRVSSDVFLPLKKKPKQYYLLENFKISELSGILISN